MLQYLHDEMHRVLVQYLSSFAAASLEMVV